MYSFSEHSFRVPAYMTVDIDRDGKPRDVGRRRQYADLKRRRPSAEALRSDAETVHGFQHLCFKIRIKLLRIAD